MLNRPTLHTATAFVSITKSNGETHPLPRQRPIPGPVAPRTTVADHTTANTGDDVFYDRLQRIWDRVLLFEDLGIIHNESDKFRYAYQLAEAEMRELCQDTTRRV